MVLVVLYKYVSYTADKTTGTRAGDTTYMNYITSYSKVTAIL